MYRLSCKPSVILYIAENKVLAGGEDRTYEGKALGRKMAIVFFEDMDAGLVRRVSRETLACAKCSSALLRPSRPCKPLACLQTLREQQHRPSFCWRLTMSTWSFFDARAP